MYLLLTIPNYVKVGYTYRSVAEKKKKYEILKK